MEGSVSTSRLSPAGRRPLRVRGAVVQALAVELGQAVDPWEGLRAWAEEHYVGEAALCGFERLADLGGLVGDERYALLVGSLLLAAGVNGGSSALPLGEAPVFPALRAHLDEVGLDVDRARFTAGLAALLRRCEQVPAEERALGRDDEARPLVVELDALYFHYLRAAEAQVADDLRALLERAPDEAPSAGVAQALVDVLVGHPLQRSGGGGAMVLSPGQLHAVAQALTSSLLVVTGGPGTGKTSLLANVLRAFARLGVPPEDMLLAAPTGRAANRMKESLEASLRSLGEPLPSDDDLATRLPPARTLHRLLGYRRGKERFQVNREAPLSGRLLVVDEVSMVSLPLMAAVLAAVPRNRPFTLLLVGDAHQLPSVETGDVLRELTRGARGVGRARRERLHALAAALDGARRPELARSLTSALEGLSVVEDASLAAHAVWLREVYRQGSDAGGRHVAEIADAIRGAPPGVPPALDVHVRETAADVRFEGVERFDWTTAEGGVEPLLRHYADTLLSDEGWEQELAQGFEPDSPRLVELVRARGRSRVLCLTHKGVAGEEVVNALISTHLDRTRPPGSFAFPGAPVLVTENDAGAGVYNGDQGVVVRVRSGQRAPQLAAAFPSGDGVVLVPLGRLPRAKLCYAMTVHKSQGSEYERVLLLLPREPSRLLARELVYTGLTRGKRAATLAGAPVVLDLALARVSERFSTLRARVEGRPARSTSRPPTTARLEPSDA